MLRRNSFELRLLLSAILRPQARKKALLRLGERASVTDSTIAP